jgi:MoxR-like ATPase
MEFRQVVEHTQALISQVRKVVKGQDTVVSQVVGALIVGGHVLLEGVPGTGKTLLARAISRVAGVEFGRIQFTPDMMPADIIGVNVYHAGTGEFVFRQGPVFADILLADEINRAPGKTQSALLEAMQEKRVTVDGKPYQMSEVFTVIATQNPVEFEGTYPLPEAQVDRFLMKVLIDYPDVGGEQEILQLVNRGFDISDIATAGLEVSLDLQRLISIRKIVKTLHVDDGILDYIMRIVRSSRELPQIALGASPRAGVMLMDASKAVAIINGREFVTPDDVKSAAFPVLRHRILLQPEFEVEGRTADDCIRELLAAQEIPR